MSDLERGGLYTNNDVHEKLFEGGEDSDKKVLQAWMHESKGPQIDFDEGYEPMNRVYRDDDGLDEATKESKVKTQRAVQEGFVKKVYGIFAS